MFKVGDSVVNIEHRNSDVQKIELVEEKRIKVFSKNMAFSYWVFKFQFRHATLEEIAAGHRIDTNTGVTVITPSGTSKVKGGLTAFIDMGADSHIENHISKNCKVIEHEAE
ncbi:hypothetical protein [Acinetobacter junii]|uniref:hypothetical protein n=1 Tax=Acinetobacter junii TaxID=40215 RepID=UPI00300A9B2E